MIKQGILERQVKFAYLSIGSNLGNRLINIEKAKFELLNRGIEIIKTSSYYETLSWPNPKNPKFYNIVLKINTIFDEIKLLSICKEIEKYLGRKKSIKNSPRECDIDIIDYNKKCNKNGLNLPHTRMHKRNFVLLPLFEIDKDWKHPVFNQNIKYFIFSLSNSDITSIKKI